MKKLLFLAFAAVHVLPLVTSQIYAQDGIWMTFTRANSGLIGDTITSIAFDGNGAHWVAARQGVAKQTQSGWTFYNTPEYMPSNEIWDIDYANGSLWFAHHDGVTEFNGTWVTFTSDNSGLVDDPVHHLAHNDQGDLWIATARGLGKYTHDKVWSYYKNENTPAMPYNGIEEFVIDASNTLWMSFISTSGIVKFPNGNSVGAKYIKQDSIPGFPKGAVYIMCLAVDGAGNLWTGTRKQGVIKINESGATVFSKNIPAIKDSNVHTVAVDKCGNIWIGTDAGAAMFDGSIWIPISVSTGHLPNDTVNTIVVDGAGHIWFGTKGGLTVFKPLPKAPDLVMPLMNMTMNDDSVLCKWTWECPNISKYWFEIATNEQFAFSTIDTTSPSLMESATKLNVDLQNNTTYYWRTRAQNDAGWSPFSDTWVFHVSYPFGVDMGNMMMRRCELMQSYPNPCIDKTTVEFNMPKNENVILEVYDVLGRQCTRYESRMGPGMCNVSLDCSMLPENGVYVYRLKAGKDILQRTMHVVR